MNYNLTPIFLLTGLLGVILGMGITVLFCLRYEDEAYNKPMDALGIEKFQKCEINTTNCHSNWYEIVYKEKNK